MALTNNTWVLIICNDDIKSVVVNAASKNKAWERVFEEDRDFLDAIFSGLDDDLTGLAQDAIDFVEHYEQTGDIPEDNIEIIMKVMEYRQRKGQLRYLAYRAAERFAA